MFATRRSVHPGAPRRRREAGVALVLTTAIVSLIAGCSSAPAAGPAPAAADGNPTSEPAFRTIPTTAVGAVGVTTSVTTAPSAAAASSTSSAQIATTTTTARADGHHRDRADDDGRRAGDHAGPVENVR